VALSPVPDLERVLATGEARAAADLES